MGNESTDGDITMPTSRDDMEPKDLDEHRRPEESEGISRGELEERGRALIERKRALEKSDEEVRERLSELGNRSAGNRDRETELDQARREFVGEWANLDPDSNAIRGSSRDLDDRRAGLAQQERDTHAAGRRGEEADQSFQELRRSIFPEHPPLGNIDERQDVLIELDLRGQQASALRQEAQALSERLSVDINEYNRQYDEFLVSLQKHLATQVEWRSSVNAWLWDRQRHNSEINDGNSLKSSLEAELRLIAAQRQTLEADEARHRQDIKAYVGPYEIDEKVRKKLMSEMDEVLWRCDDKIIVGIQFELLCMDMLASEQLSVERVGGGEDGGIDLKATESASSGREYRWLIQCKYKGKDGVVGRTEVSQFIGDLSMAGSYERACFITGGVYANDARELAETNALDLWDGIDVCRRLVTRHIGIHDRVTTRGHDVTFDDEFWDRLHERAELLHAQARRQSRKSA